MLLGLVVKMRRLQQIVRSVQRMNVTERQRTGSKSATGFPTKDTKGFRLSLWRNRMPQPRCAKAWEKST